MSQNYISLADIVHYLKNVQLNRLIEHWWCSYVFYAFIYEKANHVKLRSSQNHSTWTWNNF